MDTLLTTIILLAVTLGAIALALSIAKPVVQNAQDATALSEAQDALARLDAAIRDVANEGEGAQRVVRIAMPLDGTINDREDSIVTSEVSSPRQEYLSRRISRDLYSIGGSDVSCSDDGPNITQENSFIKVLYQKVPRTSPMAAIGTNTTILMLEEKTGGTIIYPSNTSVVIDGNTTTSNGTGFTDVLRKGTALPFCIVHMYVNSTAEYDVFYTLYAGADFVVADVRPVAARYPGEIRSTSTPAALLRVVNASLPTQVLPRALTGGIFSLLVNLTNPAAVSVPITVSVSAPPNITTAATTTTQNVSSGATFPFLFNMTAPGQPGNFTLTISASSDWSSGLSDVSATTNVEVG